MREVTVLGVGMTPFGKFEDLTIKTMGREAVESAIQDAGIAKNRIQAAYVGNAVAGLISGQECIRGQVVLRTAGIGDIPVVNVENACASASTAFHLAWMAVASGYCDVALALGVEKLYLQDKKRSFMAIGSAVDVEEFYSQAKAGKETRKPEEGAGEKRSMFMDFYAQMARRHMDSYGSTKRQFAAIAAKNHSNGSLNPNAQYRVAKTVEEILEAPLVVVPLRRLMCSPIGDGAAAAILVSAEVARQFTTHPIRVAASVLRSGMDRKEGDPDVVERAAHQAYQTAGVGPEDVEVVEVHDATAIGELLAYEELGLCGKGEGGRLIEEGSTQLTGKVPVNPSGGLESKGHPIGATGIAQIAEIVWQMRGQAGRRQVAGPPRVGLAQNGGGYLKGEAAAMAIHVFKR